MSQRNIIVTSWRKGIYLSAAFLLVLAIGAGCKKKTSNVGLGAMDPDALLNSGGVDTFQLYTYSVKEDSIPTDNQSFAVLGNYYDPKMGTFDASFYTQFHLANSVNFNDKDVPIVDSVVLSLRYRGYYGKLDPQTFEVYRLDGMLSSDSTYYKDDVIDLDMVQGNMIVPGYETQTPAPNDSVTVNGEKKVAQLRLRLDSNFGQTMLDDATIDNNPAFNSDDEFENYFKGLYVKSTSTFSPNHGGVFYFNLNDDNSRITIYYHLQGDPDQYEMVLEPDGSSADFNHVEIDNTGYPVANVIADHLNGQTQYYAQSFQSRAKVDFPTLGNLPKTSIVHNALLVIPVAHPTLGSYYPSVQMTVGYMTDENKIVGFDLVVYDDDTKSYIVDVRNYVQDILSGEAENRGVYLYPTFFSSTAERIIFNGPNTSNKEKPKLIVKYTEY